PSKRSIPRSTASQVSWTTSSATARSRTNICAILMSPGLYASTISANTASSPRFSAATTSASGSAIARAVGIARSSHADTVLRDENIACSVATSRALVEAGLHPATGGTGMLACSGDMLLQALVACAGVTMSSVATALGIHVAGSLRAEGDLDFRGTLGMAKDE